MNPVRQCVRNMQAYIPGEAANDPKIVKLNQNENRFPPSPRALKAIEQAAASLALYPESTSLILRETAARVYDLPVDCIMAGNGSDDSLRILYHCLCDPGDEVVAFRPSYTYYATLGAMYDVNYRLIDFEGEFGIPDRLTLNNAKIILLPNPNAPTGTVFPERDIRRLLEAAPGIVLVDEAYADFSGQTSLGLLKEYKNLVVVRTFSKSYSLAGLRVGLAFADPQLLFEMEKVRDFYNLDRLAQAGAAAALEDRDWHQLITCRIIDSREKTAAKLREMGLKVYPSGANFLLVRFRDADTARGIFEKLRERNVLVRYFTAPRVDACIRVSIGTETDMEVFLKELEGILE